MIIIKPIIIISASWFPQIDEYHKDITIDSQLIIKAPCAQPHIYKSEDWIEYNNLKLLEMIIDQEYDAR